MTQQEFLQALKELGGEATTQQLVDYWIEKSKPFVYGRRKYVISLVCDTVSKLRDNGYIEIPRVGLYRIKSA